MLPRFQEGNSSGTSPNVGNVKGEPDDPSLAAPRPPRQTVEKAVLLFKNSRVAHLSSSHSPVASWWCSTVVGCTNLERKS